MHPYGDKSDGWMCKTCGNLNKRTGAGAGRTFKPR
jgi:hypothetical protein